MRLVSSLLVLLCATSAVRSEGDSFYSNANRSLFVLPAFTASASSELAFARDGSSMSNPANLALDSSRELAASYAGYYLNTFSTSLVSYAAPVGDDAGIGASVAYLHLPDIEITRGLEEDPSDSLGRPTFYPAGVQMGSMSEVMVNVAYGHAFEVRPGLTVSAGAALHAIRRRLLEVAGYGIGLDIGATLALRHPGVRFAVMVEDVTTNYLYWSSSYKDVGLPKLRLGVGWRREMPYLYGRLTLAYRTPDLFGNEGQVEVSGSERDAEPVLESLTDSRGALFFRGNYGMEYIVSEVLALRVGYDFGTMRPGFGGGLNLFSRALSFDFSYLLSDLAGTYQVGATWRW